MSKSIVPADYADFISGVKERIRHARTTAVRAVNRELILLYWDLGRAIVEKQQTANWGDAIVERVAKDLRAEFPDMRGFSANNLWIVRQFYSEYSSEEFLEQLVQELTSRVPWGHHVELLKKVKKLFKIAAEIHCKVLDKIAA